MSVQQYFHSTLPSFAFGRFFSVGASKKLKLKSVAGSSTRARMNPRLVAGRENPMTLRRSTVLNIFGVLYD